MKMIQNFLKNYSTNLSGVNLSGEVADRDRWRVKEELETNSYGEIESGYILIFDKERDDNRSVGNLYFEELNHPGKYKTTTLGVNSDYRRMGIATLMYEILANRVGYENLLPVNLSEMGMSLRQDLDRKYGTTHMEEYEYGYEYGDEDDEELQIRREIERELNADRDEYIAAKERSEQRHRDDLDNYYRAVEEVNNIIREELAFGEYRRGSITHRERERAVKEDVFDKFGVPLNYRPVDERGMPL
jgi:hypothetical protein